MSKTILFVCTGNTCRSYMAQAIAKNYLAQLQDKGMDLKILSAGTGAFEGEPPSLHAKTVLSEMGLKEEDHRSVFLTPELIREADLVLVMTQNQKRHILRLDPQARDKVYLLKEYAADRAEQSRMGQKNKLQAKLGEIEKQLAVWEDRLSRVAAEEEARLRELEKEIQDKDILDPFGQPVDCYRACAAQLQEYIAKALDGFMADDKRD